MRTEHLSRTLHSAAISALTGLALSVPQVALAQSIEFGKTLFTQNCASCHGVEGAGDGPVATFIEPKPSNLGDLAAANGGMFPFGEVWAAIEGGSQSAHGTSMMPVWGDLFMAEALPKEVHPGISGENIVEARMLALTYYIQSLQK